MATESGKFRQKRKNYSQVSNIALTDKNLSLKAKGLYALIESFISIPDFVLYKQTLMNNCQEGRDAFNAAWKELKDSGYLVQYRITTGHGHFTYEYELLDEPIKEDDDQDSKIENSTGDGFSVYGESVDGQTASGKPGTYNNTDLNNTKENNTYINNISNNNSIDIKDIGLINQENVVVKEKEFVSEFTFLEKIKIERDRYIEAGVYSPDDADKVIRKIMTLCTTLNSADASCFNALASEDVLDIFKSSMIVYGYDAIESPPPITKSREAYVLGIIKNKISEASRWEK